MTAQEIKKFAEDSANVLSACQSMLHKVASERDELKARLEANGTVETISFSPEALHKAASTLHDMYGNPSNITVEQIEECWKKDPNSVVNTLNKIASDRVASIASGEHLGNSIEKKASAEEAGEVSADEALFNKYK